MTFFKKNKIKLLLIEDYIYLTLIGNFFNNSFCEHNLNIKTLNKINYLKKNFKKINLIYEQILFKLKLKNLSFLILKKELKNNNSIYFLAKKQNFKNLENVIEKIDLKLNLLTNGLKEKLKPFKLKY